MTGQPLFWKQYWDEGVTDQDPASWQRDFLSAIRPTIEQFADKPALVFLGVEVTFAELDRYSDRFARMLQAHGFGKGDVVGINLANIPEYVIAWIGTLKAGCVVSGVSPLLSPEEMVHQLHDSGARGLVTLDAIFAARLVGIVDRLPALELVVAASVGGFLPPLKRFLGSLLGKIPKGKVTSLPGKIVLRFAEVLSSPQYDGRLDAPELSPDDLAFLQYTGGTTGPSKGAMLAHRNVVADLVLVSHWLGWEKGGGPALSAFPLFHIAGLFFSISCVYFGWTQLLVPDPRNTGQICELLGRHRPTVLANVPSLYQMLMVNPRFRELDHSRLEACVSAAAPFPEESQRELESIVGQGRLMELYGMTETSPVTVMNPSQGPKKLGSIGMPLPNTEVKLVDPAIGEPVPVGEPGEICIRGPQVMLGYHNKPEETRNAIDEDGFLHTGDVAVFDEDGYLRLVDRTKDMIIVSGFKVFSKKVEEMLTEHPAVETIALIGVPNPERPGSELVRAVVQPTAEHIGDDRTALAQELTAFARERLAPYEVPKGFEIRDELPLTAIGKVDKKVLRAERK